MSQNLAPIKVEAVVQTCNSIVSQPVITSSKFIQLKLASNEQLSKRLGCTGYVLDCKNHSQLNPCKHCNHNRFNALVLGAPDQFALKCGYCDIYAGTVQRSAEEVAS